jgi:hypothetical protein
MSLSTLNTAQRQYYARPKDERFPSIDAMIAAAIEDKNLSAERTYTLKDLQVRPVGDDLHLGSPKGAARFSHWAFGSFARSVGAPAGFLRDGLSPELAAQVLNYRIDQSAPGTAVNLLVRGANGAPPIIRAATSESYGRVWDADLYSAINQQIVRPGASGNQDGWTLPPTWTGEAAGAYRGDRDSFLILTNGGSIVTDPSLTSKPGDQGAMYRGLLVRNSEVGASSIVIESILYRYVCGNHMLWGAAIDRTFRRRHVGGVRALRDTLREISTIAIRWAQHSGQRDQAIIDSLIRNEIATTKEGVIDQLRSFGATAEQATAAYDSCVRHEEVNPRSFWGAAQGLTRISQEAGYQDDRYAIDRLAGLVIARGAKVAA